MIRARSGRSDLRPLAVIFVAIAFLTAGFWIFLSNSSSDATAGPPVPTSISDFNSPDGFRGWSYNSELTTPSSSGGFTSGAGHSGQGGVFTYSLVPNDPTSGGAASIVWKPSSPVAVSNTQFLSFWLLPDPAVSIYVLLEDDSRKTFAYRVTGYSLEHQKPSEWVQVLLPLGETDERGPFSEEGVSPGRITKLQVLVRNKYKSNVYHGQIVLDDVRIIADVPKSFELDRDAAVLFPSGTLQNLCDKTGVNVHFYDNEPALDIAKRARFAMVRMDVGWSGVEKDGVYNFSELDRLVGEAGTRGQDVLFILDYGHPAHGGVHSLSRPADLAAWRSFCRAVSSHYKGNDHIRFELWNEPNYKQFLDAPNLYKAILTEGLAGVKEGNPSAVVCTGGTSGFDFDFFKAMLSWSQGLPLSAVGVHPYPEGPPETIVPNVLLLRQLVDKSLSPACPIWDTEWGYSTTEFFGHDGLRNGHSPEARQLQGVIATRTLLSAWLCGLPMKVWYDLIDDGQDGSNKEQNFGLVDAKLEAKPSLWAVEQLTKETASRKYSGLVDKLPIGIHAVKLRGSDDFMFIVWTEQSAIQPSMLLRAADVVSVSDMYGSKLNANEVSPGKIAVALRADAGPVYVKFKSSVR